MILRGRIEKKGWRDSNHFLISSAPDCCSHMDTSPLCGSTGSCSLSIKAASSLRQHPGPLTAASTDARQTCVTSNIRTAPYIFAFLSLSKAIMSRHKWRCYLKCCVSSEHIEVMQVQYDQNGRKVEMKWFWKLLLQEDKVKRNIKYHRGWIKEWEKCPNTKCWIK